MIFLRENYPFGNKKWNNSYTHYTWEVPNSEAEDYIFIFDERRIIKDYDFFKNDRNT